MLYFCVGLVCGFLVSSLRTDRKNRRFRVNYLIRKKGVTR